MFTHDFKEILIPEKQKLMLKECKFYIDYYFKIIKPIVFQIKYLSFFVENSFEKGYTLFESDSNPGFCYFIKEGEIELKLSISLINLDKKLKELMRAVNYNKELDNEVSIRKLINLI